MTLLFGLVTHSFLLIGLLYHAIMSLLKTDTRSHLFITFCPALVVLDVNLHKIVNSAIPKHLVYQLILGFALFQPFSTGLKIEQMFLFKLPEKTHSQETFHQIDM